jgi:hypothetical protein
MVYLKLQPFRHTAFGMHKNLKLTTKYYAPSKSWKRLALLLISFNFQCQLTFTMSFMLAS